MNNQQTRANLFSSMHTPGNPLVLVNAWDVASARIIEAAGARAVATTSAGVAWSLGAPDGDVLARQSAIDLPTRVMAAVSVPVSADIETGFGATPSQVANTVQAVLAAGVVGVNIENAVYDGSAPILRVVDDQCARLAAARAAADDAGVALYLMRGLTATVTANPVDGLPRNSSSGQTLRREISAPSARLLPATEDGMMDSRVLYGLTYLAAAMSLGHHIDHAIRHNAVGWPLTDEVNAFTLSLVIYPVIATGLLLYRARRVGPGFWALVSGGGAAFVSAVHFGPSAVESPEMMLDGYDSPVLGWSAFTWLVVFVTVLAITSLYETRVWWQQRQLRRAARPPTSAEVER